MQGRIAKGSVMPDCRPQFFDYSALPALLYVGIVTLTPLITDAESQLQ